MSVELPSYERLIPPDSYPGHWVVPSVGDKINFERSAAFGLVPTYDRVLHTPAVDIPQELIPGEIARMVVGGLDRAIASERRLGRMIVGLAAVQIGYGIRALMVGPDSSGRFGAFIGGHIVEEGGKTSGYNEGCFSCAGVCARVDAPDWVCIEGAVDEEGRSMSGRYHGFTARKLKHEFGHNDGVLAPDVAARQGHERVWVPAECKKAFGDMSRAMGSGTSEWPRNLVVPDDQWEALKSGEMRMDQYRLPERK